MTKSHVPSDKNKINHQDDHDHWPASIKSTLQWFTFHSIMKYTGNLMQDDTHLTSSLLNMFSMFEIHLSCGDNNLYIVSLKCINCKREKGLNKETGINWVYEFIINPVKASFCV